jgi:hypothetical protein
MKINVLTATAALSDQELLSRLASLAHQERETSAELLAHLVALEARPAAYAAQGFSSLFAYCTGALRLSEDAACARIEATRACRRYPAILDLLASGALTLTAVRLVGRHLTPENHQAVLARASGRTRREIESLVAELAPRPDVPSTVRKLPTNARPSSVAPLPDVRIAAAAAVSVAPDPVGPTVPKAPNPVAPLRIAVDRPVVLETAPERYRVQFTVGAKTHERLRRLQTLLRREIPSGDPALIFDQAIALLLEKVEKKKLASPSTPPIRPGTDGRKAGMPADIAAALRTPIVASRRVPNGVKRAVWRRDAGQCAFVTSAGQRCGERSFLEFHHRAAYALQGLATVENISLRCRRHNQYEAELIFGPRRTATSPPPPPGSSAP